MSAATVVSRVDEVGSSSLRIEQAFDGARPDPRMIGEMEKDSSGPRGQGGLDAGSCGIEHRTLGVHVQRGHASISERGPDGGAMESDRDEHGLDVRGDRVVCGRHHRGSMPISNPGKHLFATAHASGSPAGQKDTDHGVGQE